MTTYTAWVTDPDDSGTRLASLEPDVVDPVDFTVSIDPETEYQTWRGVGGHFTDASVKNITAKPEMLNKLFDINDAGGAHLSLARLPLSATDFSNHGWTWNWDPKNGVATPTSEALIAIDMVLDAKALRPDLKVMGTAWTAPPRYKNNKHPISGWLRPNWVRTYADMMAKQCEYLIDAGVPLWAVSTGNEPGHGGNYPTMLVTDRILSRMAQRLKPQLELLAGTEGGVELWCLDHNWEHAYRAENMVAMTDAYDGISFHCYGGEGTDMAGFALPVIISECTGTTDTWYSTFGWDGRNLVQQAIKSGSEAMIFWNLVLDQSSGPHKWWGCTDCRGLLTYNSNEDTYTYGPEFYCVAHLARAASPGAVVIDTTNVDIDGLGYGTIDDPAYFSAVAFKNLDGSIGVIMQNDTYEPRIVAVDLIGGTSVNYRIDAGQWLTLRTPGPLNVTDGLYIPEGA